MGRERERESLAYGFRVLCFRSDDVRFSIVISHKVFQTDLSKKIKYFRQKSRAK
jgi:hypothetical protein